jgi:hypothetical protein
MRQLPRPNRMLVIGAEIPFKPSNPEILLQDLPSTIDYVAPGLLL